VLGILAFTAPLGSVIGGLGIGFLADTMGFTGMWIVVGLAWLVCPAAGLFVQEVAASPETAAVRAAGSRGLRTMAFAILLACGVLGAFGTFLGGFGRSLVMRTGFSNTEITSTVAVSGVVTLPFPILLGYLSDRFGRLRFLGLCYLLGAAGLLVYSGASVLWQFWAGSALVAFVSYVSTGVGSALVVDLVDRGAVSRGLALFSATGWIGGILGFAAGGVLFETIGYAKGFLVGAALLAAALVLLVPIARSVRARHVPNSGGRGVHPRKA
jgi:MFS family permease